MNVQPTTQFDPAVIANLSRRGPRYTSYPTAPVWTPAAMTATRYAEQLAAAGSDERPLSLYVHIPFCRHQCLYCGCNMIVTGRQEKADIYLDYLAREMDLVAQKLRTRKRFAHLHYGGGTPTFLNEAQLTRLWEQILTHFDCAEGAELAIEVDPRTTHRDQLALLRQLGFNRVSLGVQDFDQDVQRAIGRDQSYAQTTAVYRHARELGFDQISFDLVYGLPFQTRSRFQQTIEEVIALRPNRVALFSYAHVPWMRPAQAKMDVAALPKAEERIDLFLLARQLFIAAGYQSVGMDHFALPEEDLAMAQRKGKLYRNFQGYAPTPTGDSIAFGITAISEVQGGFAQNVKKLTEYYAALDRDALPTERGWLLTAEDKLRREVIREIMCNFYVDLTAHCEAHKVAPTVFADELKRLDTAEFDGLVEREGCKLTITPLGQLVVRNVAMVFDQYLPQDSGQSLFSKTV